MSVLSPYIITCAICMGGVHRSEGVLEVVVKHKGMWLLGIKSRSPATVTVILTAKPSFKTPRFHSNSKFTWNKKINICISNIWVHIYLFYEIEMLFCACQIAYIQHWQSHIWAEKTIIHWTKINSIDGNIVNKVRCWQFQEHYINWCPGVLKKKKNSWNFNISNFMKSLT